MRKKLYLLFLLILIISTEITLGKNSKQTKLIQSDHEKHLNEKSVNKRGKRFAVEDIDDPLWMRGKKLLMPSPNYDTRYEDIDENEKHTKNSKMEAEPPFWGTRGRRDSSSEENVVDKEYPTMPTGYKYVNFKCKNCIKSSHIVSDADFENSKERRDELISPFWGNRGRRNSNEVESPNYIPSTAFLGIRDRNEENEPFWGNRGRRLDDAPFWGNRGRRANTMLLKNQGSYHDFHDLPGWVARNSREEMEPFWGNRGRREETEPFWGNRGRRQDNEPFWGNRGRRQESEPFWGNRGKRKESDDFFENREKLKEDLKQSLSFAINTVDNEIDNLSRLRRSKNLGSHSFWNNRGRDSQLKYLFNGGRYKLQLPPFLSKLPNFGMKEKPELSTVLDDRVFAEQPKFIIVERSSRSSAEQDPFYISRGKKKIHTFALSQAARDRRGAIEELVKSVRNDPYYIARGKKDFENKNLNNTSLLHEDFSKAKDLICATIDLLLIKNEVSKVKREVSDNDRDRRTILKKLAAQLQIDPYFVSRGKKSEDSGVNENNLDDFIYDISAKCH